jgi:hypothetical protein
MPKTTLIRKQVTPTGSIQPYGGGVVPDGYLICDGSIVNIADYPNLYAAIGTAHGHGNEVSPGVSDGLTFHLPDLRGRFMRGTDATAGRDLDAGARTPGNAGGNAGDNVGSVQDEAFKEHGHMYTDTIAVDGSSSGGSTYPMYDGNGLAGGANRRAATNSIDLDQPLFAQYNGSETRPVNVNVNFMIKAF